MHLHSRYLRPRSLAAVVMSIGIGGAASLALVTDASAHDNVVSGVATCAQDGTFTISWTVNYHVTQAPIVNETIVLAGHTAGGTIVGFPSTLTPNQSVTFTETGVSTSVPNPNFVTLDTTGTWIGPGTSINTVHDTGGLSLPTGGCTSTSSSPPPTTASSPPPSNPGNPSQVGTAAPTITQSACTNGTPSAAFVTIPGVTGVDYLHGATTLVAGNQTVPAGSTYTVTAIAKAGFTLAPNAVTSWTFTANGAATCAAVVLPSVTPSVLGVTFVNPPAATPAATLPFTGMPLLPTVLVGFGLLMTGALLVGSSRRHVLSRALVRGTHRA